MPQINDAVRGPISRADARALGISRRQLTGPGWRAAFRNVHVPADADATPMQRIVEAAHLLPPDGAIGGWAACYLLGARWLDGRNFAGPDLPVPLILPPRRRVKPRPGIAVLRTAVSENDIALRKGMPVTTPLISVFTHMRLSSLEAAVVGADAMLVTGLVKPEQLRAYVVSQPRVKGAPTARRAAQLMDGRSGSPQESLLRLVWVLEAQLPPPHVNSPVYGDLGHLLGIPDLLEPDSGLVAEYDGAGHRESLQHSNDNAREEELERAGLTVVRVTGLDLAHRRRRVVHRLRAAYRDGLARDHQRDHWSLSQTPAWVNNA